MGGYHHHIQEHALRISLPLVLLCGCGDSQPQGAPGLPDVVVVALDTVRWDHTSLSDYERDTTPVLAALSALPGARTFTRAWSPAAWSLPAYASLFTGREALSHGVGFEVGALPTSIPTLAEVFAAYGYQTAAFCSGPHLDPSTGLARGFGVFEHHVANTSLLRATDGALRWAAGQRDPTRPSLVFVQGYDAHIPITTPSVYADLFAGDSGRVAHRDTARARQDDRSAGGRRFVLDLSATASPDVLRAEEERLAADHLVVGDDFRWFRPPGGERVDVGDRHQRRALRRLVHGATQRAKRTRDGRAGGPPAAPQGPPPRPVIDGALDGLAAAGLEPLLVERDGGRILDPAVPVKLLRPVGQSGGRDIDDYVAHYDAAVLTADYHLGRLLRGLDTLSLFDDAIVVVLADHGEALGEDGRIAHDGEEGDAVFRVPLVVRLPDGAPPARWDGLVSLVDVVPTLAGLLDFEPPAGVDGADLGGPLADPTTPADSERILRLASLCCEAARTLEWELRGTRQPAARVDGSPALVRPHSVDARFWQAMSWTLHADGAGPDVAADHPDVVRRLRAPLDAWPALGVVGGDVSHGVIAERPDLVEALREGGYWSADEHAAEDGAEIDRGGAHP